MIKLFIFELEKKYITTISYDSMSFILSCGNAAQSTTRIDLRKRSSKQKKNKAVETQLKVEEE